MGHPHREDDGGDAVPVGRTAHRVRHVGVTSLRSTNPQPCSSHTRARPSEKSSAVSQRAGTASRPVRSMKPSARPAPHHGPAAGELPVERAARLARSRAPARPCPSRPRTPACLPRRTGREPLGESRCLVEARRHDDVPGAIDVAPLAALHDGEERRRSGGGRPGERDDAQNGGGEDRHALPLLPRPRGRPEAHMARRRPVLRAPPWFPGRRIAPADHVTACTITGRIISLSSWSTMWQCHTYGPEVTARNAGCAWSRSASPGAHPGSRRDPATVVFQLPSHFATTVRTSPG